jgi:VIT1/CCC1 family predicted Fe2+/Mn2+ transporter
MQIVLALSRPALYPKAFRIQAMQLIIAQIATRQTYYLRCSISSWEIDHQELVSFLSEIIGVALFSKRG